VLCLQAFAGGEAEAADDNIVNQLRYKRNMLGDLIAAKDVQVRTPAPAAAAAGL
jgi:hypothetical protein